MATEFHRWVENRHEAVKEWKAKNKKLVCGYLCCMTPEELIYAAGMLPVRVAGSSEPLQIVDDHVVLYGCGCVRSCLDLAGRGVYSYLDHMVVSNTCDLVARCEYWWRAMDHRTRPTLSGVELNPYHWYLKIPEKMIGTRTLDFFNKDLRFFRQHLERSTHSELTDEKIAKAIEVYNEHYDLMAKLHEMRKQKPPLISGYEAWEVEFASLLMPKDEHNKLMKEFLEELPKRQEKPKEGVRLYLTGSAMDPEGARLYQIIEDCGGQVVSEDLSWGTSYFWRKIATDIDPLKAIAEHRLDVHCPSKTVDGYQTPYHRWDYIKKTMAGYDVKGVVIYNLNYCECRSLENPRLRDRFRDEYHIPALFLEGDYTRQGLELTRDKIQAFIEMLEG